MSIEDRVGPIIVAFRAQLVADAALLALLGGEYVYRRYSVGRIEQIPGVYWHVVSEVPVENVWTAIVDFDVWGTSYTQVRQIGDRLTAIMHRETPHEIGGIDAWTQLESSGDLGDPGETTSRRLYRFRFEPVRA